MVLDRLDHHLVLLRWLLDSEHTRLADGAVGHHAGAGDLVRLVDDHDGVLIVGREQPRELAKHARLADVGRTDEQQPALDERVEVRDPCRLRFRPAAVVQMLNRRHEHRQHATLDRPPHAGGDDC